LIHSIKLHLKERAKRELGDIEHGKVKDSRSGSCANHQGS